MDRAVVADASAFSCAQWNRKENPWEHLARAALLRWTTGGLLIVASLGAAAATPPPPDARVTDRAGVLSPDVRTTLARRLDEYEARSGHQVVVWIDRSSVGVPIEEFAVEAFAAWKIGRTGLDDGLAILP